VATTLTAVATTVDGELALAHIGDSRAYRITAEQTLTHPLRSVLLAVLHRRDDDVAKLETSTLLTQPDKTDRQPSVRDGIRHRW
jgi:serine/threonine protein phosphatase PrpC